MPLIQSLAYLTAKSDPACSLGRYNLFSNPKPFVFPDNINEDFICVIILEFCMKKTIGLKRGNAFHFYEVAAFHSRDY